MVRSRNILAAVDPMHEYDKPAELDHEIMDMAQRFCEFLSGELHVVHTCALPELLASTPAGQTWQTMETRQHSDLLVVKPPGHAESVQQAAA